MEMYKKPVMNIIEMENADVLTCSGHGGNCYAGVVHTGYGDGCSSECRFDHTNPDQP